jgi:prepilin-type N-terminal cleavage/methylation domain-containing protein
MRLRPTPHTDERGFTLIETIIGLVVMTILVIAVTNLFVSNLKSVTLGKARAMGQALASQQIEELRDLPYQSVATASGAIYPPGNLPDTQTVVRGGYTFTVKTEINYVDDAYDNLAPTDLNPADYKKAQVSVYLKSSGQLVSQLSTDIAGKAAETASNTGILRIKVIDANGQPIANANVTIVNTNPNPDVNITTNTDSLGLVLIPNLPLDSSNRYLVTASLSGYSTDGTQADPAGSPVAVQLNPNVLVQQITSLTLAIDRVASMNVHVVDTSGAALASKAIRIRGAKALETTSGVASKWKYDVTSTTDASGDIALSSIEWDSYSFTPPSGYYLVSAQPYAPVAVSPNGSQSVILVLSTSSTYPTISSTTPITGQTGTTNQGFTIVGTNMSSSSVVKLQKSGQADITATGIAWNNTTKKLTGTFNLAGAATGAWDLAVTNSGNTATQTGGFSVTP